MPPPCPLPQAVVDQINGAIADCRAASQGEDLAALREKIAALNTAAMEIGKALAGSAGAAGGASSGETKQ